MSLNGHLAEGFAVTHLSDLLAEPEEEAPFLVDGLLIAGGVSLIGAKPKVGKTTFARNLALSVARGEPFLGRRTAPGRVALLCLEEKRHEVRRLFARLGGSDEAIDIHVGRAPAAAGEAFEQLIAAGGYRLAIVDPLAKLVRVRDLSDFAEVSRALEPLIEIARRHDCHIVLVHHLGKADRTDADDILGSTALFGAVDAVLILKKRDQGRTLYSIQRYGADLPETVITLDAETGALTTAGDVAGLLLREAVAAVSTAVVAEEGLKEAEIRERVGGNNTLTARAIREMVADGLLTRTGKGRKNEPYVYSPSAMLDARFAPNKQEASIEHSAPVCPDCGGPGSPARTDARCYRCVGGET